MTTKKKSPYASSLDAIESALAPALKAAGFFKRNRTFNRPASDGLVHVVNFQSGQYPIGDYVIPGFRESLYGLFAVNLGVHVPEARALSQPTPPPSFVQDYHCEFRARLTSPTAASQGQWWSLDPGNVKQVIEDVAVRMDEQGEAFFRPFWSRRQVLDRWTYGAAFPFSNPERSALVAAALLVAEGDRARAAEFIRRVVADTDHRGFRDFVRTCAVRWGIEV